MNELTEYDKIVQCEVAREAINARFRDYLFLERQAREQGDDAAYQAASATTIELIQLRDRLNVEDFDRNLRIAKGDFLPPAPQVPEIVIEKTAYEIAVEKGIRYEVALEILGQSLQPFVQVRYGKSQEKNNPKLEEYCRQMMAAISHLQDTLDSDDTDIIDLILDSQNKLFRF